MLILSAPCFIIGAVNPLTIGLSTGISLFVLLLATSIAVLTYVIYIGCTSKTKAVSKRTSYVEQNLDETFDEKIVKNCSDESSV